MLTKKTRAQKEREFERATKLWQILRIALHDLAECERSCEIDMDTWWFSRDKERCRVCLAGSVMRQRLVTPKMKSAAPGFFTKDEFEKKLRSLDHLRQGNVGAACREMGQESAGPNRDIIDYEDDSTLWWKQMRQLLRDLKRANV